ncbi:von Willebrand factor type A [Trinorchestia longiramus]|nr:von Willebrand factor type A [Trinorchestia longiramus]
MGGTAHVISHLLVLLTDGRPTHGVTHTKTLLDNARKRNKHRAAIFTLAFGKDADQDLLEKLALQHGGATRRIYEDVDVAEQLHGFYKELATPLLMDVQFSYTEDSVLGDSLTKTHFYNYFKGSELVVSGQTRSSNGGTIRANITGHGRNGEITMGVTVWNLVPPPDRHLLRHLHLAPTPRNFVRRLWAFLSVKDLLEEEKSASSHHARATARRRALALALQNHFVTPLTSLVVMQPDEEHCKDYEEDNEEDDADGQLDEDGERTDEVLDGDEEPSEEEDEEEGIPHEQEEVELVDHVEAPEYHHNESTDSEWYDPKEGVGEDQTSAPSPAEELDPDRLNADNMARTYDLSPRIFSDAGDYPLEEYNALDPQMISKTFQTPTSGGLRAFHSSWLLPWCTAAALLYHHVRTRY